jgi:predicted RNase H-like HicB family nuclease
MGKFFQTTEFKVKVHSEDGGYWAEVEEMPGCFVSGDTIDEIKEALAEAMGLYLSSENVTIKFNHVNLQNPVKDDGTQLYTAAIPA